MSASNEYSREILLGFIDLADTIYRRERAIEDALATRDISLVGDQLHDLILKFVGIDVDSDAAGEVLYSGRTREQKADELERLAGL